MPCNIYASLLSLFRINLFYSMLDQVIVVHVFPFQFPATSPIKNIEYGKMSIIVESYMSFS